MSGIVGILHTDGAPIDRGLLGAMTGALRFRGPDAERIWLEGNIGFGHTLFATTHDAWRERQPFTLDGNAWIVADARVDARDELRGALEGRGRTGLTDATDAELLLHAYAVWGEGCVAHLLGDFVFAIWNRREGRLFCARDPLGCRPFFYASARNTLVFSNTFACVRRHPDVPATIDERTIGDFLLFKYNLRHDATGLEAIRRLPPGHTLTWSPSEPVPRTRRYWQFALPAEIRYRRPADYLEHFEDVFARAVSDRLRAPHVAVSMSGGIDSTLIAAVAMEVGGRETPPVRLEACTNVYDEFIPDEERHYASLAAETIGIPIRLHVSDGYPAFESSGLAGREMLPEPVDSRFSGMALAFRAAVASTDRVVLSGDDADCLFNEVTFRRFEALRGGRRFGTLAAEMIAYTRWMRRYPPIGLRAALGRWRGAGADDSSAILPAWINPEFARQNDLAGRWREIREARQSAWQGLRPRATGTIPEIWWRMFENGDATTSGLSLEYRWPFADRRVVEYALAISAVPWCTDKTLLREACRGRIPEQVRRRPKTPVGTDPMVEWFRRSGSRWVDRFEAVPGFGRYVNRSAIPPMTGSAAGMDNYEHLRPLMLNWWLEQLNGKPQAAGTGSVV